jgi:hypothetical protein
MKKLSLNAADLHVLSFDTAAVAGEAGTVHGAAANTPTCQPYPDAATCAKPCLPTVNPAVTNPCICLV